jgi:hypothetical protein
VERKVMYHGDPVAGEVRVDAVRYRKYITGTDRRSIRNPDFLCDKAEIKLV